MKDSIKLLSVPVLNRYDLLEKMIDSIDYPIDEILILNNGKEKYTPKNKNFNFTVLNLPSNLGCSGSWNLTIKLYPHLKYWCFASTDILFSPESLNKLQ
jgi:GT2 family glycosyltransferase